MKQISTIKIKREGYMATLPETLADMPEFMTPAETAEVLRTTVNTLAQNRFLGRGLPYIKNGRNVLYAREDLLAYLAAGRKQTQEAGIR